MLSDPDDSRRTSAPLWYRLEDEWGRVNKLRAAVEFHHNLKDLLPPSKFGVSHPEFYPILNGKRFVPPDDESFQWQPNSSAPGIARVAADEIIRHFEAHPEKDSYSLGINDSYRFDESPESKARRSGKKNGISLEDISDDYYQWANEVVELVAENNRRSASQGTTLRCSKAADPDQGQSPILFPSSPTRTRAGRIRSIANASKKITLMLGRGRAQSGVVRLCLR